MDEKKTVNSALLRGVVAGAPSLSHVSRGESFYVFPVETARLSGTADRLNVTVREQLLDGLVTAEAEKIRIDGELRSYNNKRSDGAKLVITVFARDIRWEDGEDMNRIELTGSLCKLPNLRTTPMGRDICDLMLAVGRRYGRSDYLPCICWGLKARQAAGWSVGDTVALEGRLQSRQYIKLTDDGALAKTAFEVSVIDIAKL